MIDGGTGFECILAGVPSVSLEVLQNWCAKYLDVAVVIKIQQKSNLECTHSWHRSRAKNLFRHQMSWIQIVDWRHDSDEFFLSDDEMKAHFNIQKCWGGKMAAQFLFPHGSGRLSNGDAFEVIW